MPVVAIAGGTGHLGHALVDGLLAHGGIDVVVLAREVSQIYHINGEEHLVTCTVLIIGLVHRRERGEAGGQNPLRELSRCGGDD